MPRIFDNIDLPLLPALQDTLRLSKRADFCVGYFNLRGWRRLDTLIDSWCGGSGACCRVLVGMQALPSDELRTAYSLIKDDAGIDNQTALRLKKRLAEEFREQLSFGAPSNVDEEGLRRLSAQIKAGKVVVKLFLRHPLHAKLYLLHRQDPNNPTTGFLGSSNLTLAGLAKQGELNVDNGYGKFVGALLNSTLFFFWFVSVGNGRNITGTDIEQFSVAEVNDQLLQGMPKLFDSLMQNYVKNSFVRERKDCEFQKFQPSKSKPIIDEIDRILAQHYGFTDEELDFIINYDIKYRLGAEAEE